MHPLRFSVVIPTLNRDESLRNCLKYFLFDEDYSHFEIIVVDQSNFHDEPTWLFLNSHLHRFTHVQCDYKGLPRARNHGISLASGDVVLFIDDDCEPAPGFLQAHAEGHSDPTVVCVAGPTPSTGQELATRAAVGEAVYARLNSQQEARFDIAFPYYAQWAPGGNCSYKRQLCYEIGGFDEAFKGAAIGEDAEFAHRAKQRGRIWYTPQAFLVHRHVPAGGCRDLVDRRAHVSALTFSTNYFWHRVDGARFHRLRQLWCLLRGEIRNQPFRTLVGFLHGYASSVSYMRTMPPPPRNSYFAPL